jgi:hypothetical protein
MRVGFEHGTWYETLRLTSCSCLPRQQSALTSFGIADHDAGEADSVKRGFGRDETFKVAAALLG